MIEEPIGLFIISLGKLSLLIAQKVIFGFKIFITQRLKKENKNHERKIRFSRTNYLY